MPPGPVPLPPEETSIAIPGEEEDAMVAREARAERRRLEGDGVVLSQPSCCWEEERLMEDPFLLSPWKDCLGEEPAAAGPDDLIDALPSEFDEDVNANPASPGGGRPRPSPCSSPAIADAATSTLDDDVRKSLGGFIGVRRWSRLPASARRADEEEGAEARAWSEDEEAE